MKKQTLIFFCFFILISVNAYAGMFDLDTVTGFFGKYFKYKVNMEALQRWAGLGAVAIFVMVPYGVYKLLFSLSRLPFASDVAAGGMLLSSLAIFIRLAAYSAVFLLAVQLWPLISPWVKALIETAEGLM